MRGGDPRKLCSELCRAVWSSDGRFLYVNSAVSASGKTLVIPMAGNSLPDLPSSGIDPATGEAAPEGMRVIEQGAVSPGPDPSTYVFTKTDLQRNLFRIPLH
jgi:hypothetical protein